MHPYVHCNIIYNSEDIEIHVILSKCSQRHVFFLEGNVASFGKVNFRRSGKLLDFFVAFIKFGLLRMLKEQLHVRVCITYRELSG